MEAGPSARPFELFESRSPIATTCPFFRSDANGELVAPIEDANPANRCIALDEPQPLSPRHQRLVCLTSDHVNCPRYLRGADMAQQRAELRVPHARTLTTAIFAAILILVASSAASLAFVVARGGIDIPLASPTTGPFAAVSPAPTPAPRTVAVSSIEPSLPTPSVSFNPSPALTAAPTPRPSAIEKPSPTPDRTAAPTPRPTSDRFAVIVRCPDRPDCWIYTIRAGDNLYSIAHWFGVSLDRVYAMNPWTRTRGIHAGDELLIPTPTR